jgi:hypothetical protein
MGVAVAIVIRFETVLVPIPRFPRKTVDEVNVLDTLLVSVEEVTPKFWNSPVELVIFRELVALRIEPVFPVKKAIVPSLNTPPVEVEIPGVGV